MCAAPASYTPLTQSCAPVTCHNAESEFALLLEAAAGGGTFERFTSLLLLMATEINHLTEATIGVIQRFFQGPVAAAALGAGSHWEVCRAVPEADGRLDVAGEW